MAMRHRQHEEEHLNHEAWAIPYGDLVTLLLAFFVVMYAVSSVNAGKYRVMADALSSAFGGPPRTLSPSPIGESHVMSSGVLQGGAVPVAVDVQRGGDAALTASRGQAAQLDAIGARMQQALAGLVDQRLVSVRQGPSYIEIAIQSDVLFASGSAAPSATAIDAISRLGDVLREQPNAVRVEGYTDDQPIRTRLFESNWELSAARAASVVHVLAARGVAQPRLAVIGYGQYQPVADNTTVAGRNANRRVQLVILSAPDAALPDAALPAATRSAVGAPDVVPSTTGAVAAGATPVISAGTP